VSHFPLPPPEPNERHPVAVFPAVHSSPPHRWRTRGRSVLVADSVILFASRIRQRSQLESAESSFKSPNAALRPSLSFRPSTRPRLDRPPSIGPIAVP